MKAEGTLFTLAVLAVSAPMLSNAIELEPSTLHACDEYIGIAGSRIQVRLDGRFVWAGEVPQNSLAGLPDRFGLREQLQALGVVYV